MFSKPVIFLLLIFLIIVSIGFVYSANYYYEPEEQEIDGENGLEIPIYNGTNDNGTGTILVSENSQDLIIINRTNATGNNTTDLDFNRHPEYGRGRFTQVSQSGRIPHTVSLNGSDSILFNAYCMEPSQKAVPGDSLSSPGSVQSAVILKTVRDSNPSDPQSAADAQMKIWVLVSGGNLDTSQGEASTVASNMSNEEFKSNLTKAKNDLMNEYRVSEDKIGDLVEFKIIDMMGFDLIDNFLTIIQQSMNIYSNKITKVNNTTNITSNNTTDNTTTNDDNNTINQSSPVNQSNDSTSEKDIEYNGIEPLRQTTP